MTFVVGLLGVIAVLSSILLMFVVLLQEPKGGGLAAALGGSGMDAIGANVGQVNRFTSWIAGIWIVSCLALSMASGFRVSLAAAGTPDGKPAVDAPPEKPADAPADPKK